MNSTRSLVKLAPPAKLMGQTRNMSAISGPPATRISFPEKVAHGVVMFTGWIAFPVWVLTNIKNYRSGSK